MKQVYDLGELPRLSCPTLYLKQICVCWILLCHHKQTGKQSECGLPSHSAFRFTKPGCSAEIWAFERKPTAEILKNKVDSGHVSW